VGSGPLVPGHLLTRGATLAQRDTGRMQTLAAGRTAMPVMKITVDAAMRVRDVSLPGPADEARAAAADAAGSTAARPAARANPLPGGTPAAPKAAAPPATPPAATPPPAARPAPAEPATASSAQAGPPAVPAPQPRSRRRSRHRPRGSS